MIPSVLSRHVEQGIKDFLRTTFPVTTPLFSTILERLLNEPGNVFKGPYLDSSFPSSRAKEERITSQTCQCRSLFISTRKGLLTGYPAPIQSLQ